MKMGHENMKLVQGTKHRTVSYVISKIGALQRC
jgi:hypothetical protein